MKGAETGSAGRQQWSDAIAVSDRSLRLNAARCHMGLWIVVVAQAPFRTLAAGRRRQLRVFRFGPASDSATPLCSLHPRASTERAVSLSPRHPGVPFSPRACGRNPLCSDRLDTRLQQRAVNGPEVPLAPFSAVEVRGTGYSNNACHARTPASSRTRPRHRPHPLRPATDPARNGNRCQPVALACRRFLAVSSAWCSVRLTDSSAGCRARLWAS